MVKAARVSASGDALLDPQGEAWRSLGRERIQLLATPLTLQPSEYVQTKWAALKHGEAKEIRVAAAHNAQAIYFRLEWDDATDDGRPNDTADFPDQASVMLPIWEACTRISA